MALQTNYGDRQPKGFPGMKVDGEAYNAVTGILEVAAIGFGLPVSQGTEDNGIVAATDANDGDLIGITLRDVSLRPTDGDEFAVGGNVPVLTSGSVWVRVSGAVAANDDANFHDANQAFTVAAVAAGIWATGWKFATSAADGELAKLVKRA